MLYDAKRQRAVCPKCSGTDALKQKVQPFPQTTPRKAPVAAAKATATPKPKAPPKPRRSGPETFQLVPPKEDEKDIQKRIMRGLRRRGWVVVRFNSGSFPTFDKSGKRHWFMSYYIFDLKDSRGHDSTSGLPDVMAFKGNEFLMIEVKAKDGKLRPAQAAFIRYAATAGVYVHVVDNWEELAEYVSALPV